MLKEKTELLKELVSKISGKNTEVIVDIISGGKPVNEFKIAERLKLTINQTRNILYKLLAQGMVYSIRKKDVKKGWYIYSWSINYQKSMEKLTEMKKKEINQYEHVLQSRQSKRFYVCPSECIEVSDENAMLHDFKCQECGQLLQFKSFEQEIQDLKSKIDLARAEISIIKVELDKVHVEREKKDVKDMEKKKKERQEKRAIARKKAIREKNKVIKVKLKAKEARAKKKKLKVSGKKTGARKSKMLRSLTSRRAKSPKRFFRVSGTSKAKGVRRKRKGKK
ncbi:MAG: hypothetical protein KKE23_02675 [Nanoarchaeota archaeon]|nr:hypothetical protein [Nanoarchaeota archaeon]